LHKTSFSLTLYIQIGKRKIEGTERLIHIKITHFGKGLTLKRRKLLSAAIPLVAITIISANAEPALDLNPPTWRGDPYSTTQQWTFPTEDYQPYADAWDNPFGPMQLEILPANTDPYYDPSSSAWKWENLQYLGAGDESQQMMRIETQPNWPDSATNKKAWVQITWGVHFYGIDAPYDRASMLYLSPFEGFDGIFPTPAIDAQTLGIETDFFGNTVEWYHTTFQIPFVSSYIEYDFETGDSWIVEEDSSWGAMFMYPYAGGVLTPEPLSGEYDIYISQVIVDTICVPEPGTVMLLALGSLTLRRRK